MQTLEFYAIFSNENKIIKVIEQKSSGACEIYIDNYLQGTLTTYKGDYNVHLNNKSCLTGDDVMILIEMLKDPER